MADNERDQMSDEQPIKPHVNEDDVVGKAHEADETFDDADEDEDLEGDEEDVDETE